MALSGSKAQADRAAASFLRCQSTSPNQSNSRGNFMRIAYVEDNPTNQALVERVAGMNHHVIVTYNEGEVAVKELLLEKFDLILMDVELAGELGGLAVVRQLRSSGVTTSIVAVTAYAMMGDRDKCLEAGCDDYLPKPLPIVELVAMLAHYDEIARRVAAGEPVPERIVPVPVESAPSPIAPVIVAPPVPISSEVKPDAPAVESKPADAAKVPEIKAHTPTTTITADKAQDITPVQATAPTDNSQRSEPL